MNREIFHIRKDYDKDELCEQSVPVEPYPLFAKWMATALDTKEILEPTAMAISTVGNDGRPSARMVLLKQYSAEGFIFYTNYDSKKAQQMAENPQVALLFHWDVLERQIRIEGRVEKVSREVSEAYFKRRPLGSRIGATASPQSKVLEGRELLEKKVADLERQYTDSDDIPLPDDWGGYILKADYYEFWQGRKSRLHDRISYKQEGEKWKINRLAP